MKRLLILLLAVTLLAEEPFTRIEDTSNLPLLSPAFSMRKTSKIRLSNGLELLLISDPEADQSAATVSVATGSWNDPIEYPGMAHFCEHMLFMGTAKYPDTNLFSSEIANYDGTNNAFTSADRTVYMFSSRTEGFLPLLDQFAHFFIDPLFDPSNIAREMHAVDQEFALHKNQDNWRKYMVFKELGNPDHPNHLFSTGNSQTLANIPQSALVGWHKKTYSADRIRAALYSPLPLETLEQTAITLFQEVPSNQESLPSHSEPITSPQLKGHFVTLQPIKDQNILSLSWELPPHLAKEGELSAKLIAYTLSRGNPNSLYEQLNKEKWIDNLSISADLLGGPEHLFFDIDLVLSKKGNEQIDQVIERVFQALAGLKKTSIPETLYLERNQASQLFYQYMPREDAFSYISTIGASLSYGDLSTYPRHLLLDSQYDPQKTHDILSFLTPDQCLYFHIDPSHTTFDKKEKWLGVPYSVRPLTSQQLAAWNNASPHPDIRLPDPNTFLPSELTLVPDPELGNHPVCIAQTPQGKAYYVRSPELKTIDASLHLHIYSPALTPSPKTEVLTSLYLDLLTDQLHPLLATAGDAGLSFSPYYKRGHLHFVLNGFSEKLPLYLSTLLHTLPPTPPTAEEFALSYTRHEKSYKNASKELAIRQAHELLGSLLNSQTNTANAKLTALQKLTYDDFLTFHKELFEKTYFQALFSGNLSLKTSESAWLDILHTFSKTLYPLASHPTPQALHLPESEGPFSLTQTTDTHGNATVLLIDQGDFTFERRAAQEILSSALNEAFFDTLRTKQKTGYITSSQDIEFERRLYQFFAVQSNSHQPEDLLHRFELFLEDYRQDFTKNISPERFDLLRQGAIASIQTRYRNLQDKSALWDRLAFEDNGDFTFIDKRTHALEALTYETFSTLSEEFLSRTNRKRLALLFEGKIAAPFTYTPITLPQFGEIAQYTPRPPDTTN